MFGKTWILQVALIYLSTHTQNGDVDASTDSIRITEGPANETKAVREQTFCQCIYNGTNDPPFWNINGTSYAVTNLPEYYEVNTSGILFPAFSFLDDFQYQCYFLYYDDEVEGFTEIESYPGLLNIPQAIPEAPLVNCKPSIPGILVDSGKVTLNWLPHDGEKCMLDTHYTIETATCQSSQIVTICDTNVSNTQATFPTNNCSIKENWPLLFRVKGTFLIDSKIPTESSYLYFNELNDTDIRKTDFNTTEKILLRGTPCKSNLRLCINGTLFQNCFFLNELPPRHRICGEALCIDVDEDNNSSESVNNNIYTVICATDQTSPECCRQYVDWVGYNFRLVISSGKNMECSTVCIVLSTVLGGGVGGLGLVMIVIFLCCQYWKHKHCSEVKFEDSKSNYKSI